jgi:altronate dehydratase large subunit
MMEPRAIVIDQSDNVATALTNIITGQKVSLVGGRKSIKAKDDIRVGHKLAIRNIKAGEAVIKYGEVIGRAVVDILVGEHVHTHNTVGLRGFREHQPRSMVAKVRRTEIALPDGVPKSFMGYRRSDNTCAVRNHVLVLPTVICASRVAEQIASLVKGAVCVVHPYGCTFSRSENEFLERVFINYASNPNVFGVIVVALGCETVDFSSVAEGLSRAGKPVELVVIQRDGGSDGAIAKGMRIATAMVASSMKLRREEIPISELTIAVECGGSDAFSGLTANPAVGFACDMHIALGGTVIFSETAEVIGGEHILAMRAVNESVAKRFLEIVRNAERGLAKVDTNPAGAFIARGNIEGGLTTLEEKSLGCIRKAGTQPLQEVVLYGERPKCKGLVFMDTPGHDVKSITGMVAGGAQIVIFTTGRGTPVGCPIAPVIKVGSNRELVEHMPTNIDVDASTIAEGTESISDVGMRIYKMVADVASGKMTRSEMWGHREFALPTEGIISGCRPDG